MPTRIVFNDAIPASMKETWIQLRALAWGKQETPALTTEQLERETGKDIKTIYAHMRSLRAQGVCSWRSGGDSTFIVSFDDAGEQAPEILNNENSQNRELPYMSLTNNKGVKDKTKNTQFSKSRILENENGAKTKAIQAEYVRLLGYEPPDWAAGEGAAAKWIGAHYSVEQLTKAYTHYKSQAFWQDKPLKLRHLKSLIPEWIRATQGLNTQSQAKFKDYN